MSQAPAALQPLSSRRPPLTPARSYEPADDTFLLLDVLAHDLPLTFRPGTQSPTVLEIG